MDGKGFLPFEVVKMSLRNRVNIGMVGMLATTTIFAGLPIYGKAGSGQWEVAITTGRTALKSGDYSEAKRNLTTALDSTRMFQTNDPRLGDTYSALGELYLGDQDYAQAKEYFNRALMVQQATPGIDQMKLADTLYGLATATEMLGDRDMAIILLKRVRDIWTSKHGSRSPKLISVLKPLGIYSTVNGDLKLAETCYRDLVAIQEQSGSSQADVGSSLNLLAATLTREGKLDEASTTAERAVRLLASSGNDDMRIAAEGANDNLAYINQQLGKQTTQIASAPTGGGVVTRAPGVSTAAIMAGRPTEEPEAKETTTEQPKEKPYTPPPVTVHAKPVVAAVPAEKKATQPAPDLVATKTTQPDTTKIAIANTGTQQTRVLHTVGASTQTHVNEFRPWELKKDGTQTTAATPPNANWGKIRFLAGGRLISQEEYQAMLLANEAYELIRTEKYKMACDILKKALGICPTLASAHTNLGLALTQLGQTDEAIDHLKQAIDIDPNRSAAWVNLASAFQLNGQLKESLVTYTEYVHRFPDQPLAKKATELAANLDKEVKEQAAIASAGTPVNGPDYFAYASHTVGTKRWGDQTKLKVYIHPASSVPGYKSEYDGFCADAFKQWTTASGNKLAFEFVKKPQDANIEWVWTNDASKIASVAEGGETNVDYDGAKITHATVTVLTKNPAMDSPLSPNQIRAVSLHEIGHALGLIGHSPRPQDIMYCSMPPAMSRPSLTSRDVNTIEKLYTQTVSYVRKLLYGS